MYRRYLESRLPKHSFFLFGPRQVGKSTLLGKIKNSVMLDLMNAENQLKYSKDPLLLAKEISPQSSTVILDEIQRVPSLLDVVQLLMKDHQKIRFILSGSSARKLRRGSANLLGGRALYRTLHPLTLQELGDDFNLEWILSYGTLPHVYSALKQQEEKWGQDLLRSYVITYLSEEIRAEAIVRNIQGFQNFLEMAATQFSEQVNLSGISRDCGVAYTTVREYYLILEDTLIGFFLRPCLRSLRKRMSLSPKFYFFDNGVTRSILGGLKSPPTILERGRLFEQWMIQEIYRKNLYEQRDWKLSFWRTSHGAEIDLIIEQGRDILCAIEFKHKQNISRADFRGIHSFKEAFPKVPCYLVSPLKLPQRWGDILCLSPKQLLEKELDR